MSAEHRSDRSSRKGLSWVETWKAGDSELQTAVRQICAYRNINEADYEGVTVTEGQEFFFHRTEIPEIISFDLTPAEIRSSPKAIRGVLKDIGVSSTDKVSLQLGIPSADIGFLLTIRPYSITDKRIGITLSTVTKDGAVIAPAFYDRSRWDEIIPDVKTLPFFPFSGENYIKQTRSVRAYNAWFAYRGISGNVDGSGGTRSHPYLVEIMTSAAEWATPLLALRKKPAT